MTFGRSDAEFWRMTPAQLVSLSETHRKVNGKGGARESRPEPTRGGAADLLALSQMQRV